MLASNNGAFVASGMGTAWVAAVSRLISVQSQQGDDGRHLRHRRESFHQSSRLLSHSGPKRNAHQRPLLSQHEGTGIPAEIVIAFALTPSFATTPRCRGGAKKRGFSRRLVIQQHGRSENIWTWKHLPKADIVVLSRFNQNTLSGIQKIGRKPHASTGLDGWIEFKNKAIRKCSRLPNQSNLQSI